MTIYQSGRHGEGEAAYALLAAHRIDPETEQCPICLIPGPCQPANAAANRLAELGLPIIEPTAPERPGRWTDGLRTAAAWIAPRPAAAPRAPLLTFGWRWRLGLVRFGQGR